MAESDAEGRAARNAPADHDGPVDDLTSYAVDRAEALREHALRLIEERKAAAADTLIDVAAALHEAAHQLSRRERASIARLADSAAARIEDTAMTWRARDFATLIDDARRLARAQPELVFAGALALGFVASRVIRSRTPQRSIAPSPAAASLGER